MTVRTITSMTRTRFDELRADVADGSLAQRLHAMTGKEEDELTRAQRVELNQARAIANIYLEDSDLLAYLVRESWRELRLIEKNGKVQVALKREPPPLSPATGAGAAAAATGRRGAGGGKRIRDG